MSDSILLEEKWKDFFIKIDRAKIDYIKGKCGICSQKELKHYSECTHIKIDVRLIRISVNKKLKKDGQDMLKEHMMLSKA